MSDLADIERRWSTNHDRGAHDYTDAGCRVLAEHAFRDIAALRAERDAHKDALREVLPILEAHTQMLRTLPFDHRARVKLRHAQALVNDALASAPTPRGTQETGT